MSNLSKFEFTALDISGNNYLPCRALPRFSKALSEQQSGGPFTKLVFPSYLVKNLMTVVRVNQKT
ncbi:hypothetical protein HanRHA438_Chr08g0348981 [Helianthus annuus]|uniref:Uncharacterized protein n=1 Tax=Helianthus annuus TaxID=4232 RepID=A0A9K3NCJ0_HELAN|nr:hypothetical protein HanXRQr2_Chr08g0337721 [Helianthus annuus]KAJ0897736.1 hypothetical protein HanRHA438_Chr08g0348981 [Helianthus annuus]KAJ0901508.1 hypothetical protein HanPSC8_Chr08g0326131 [Helianthus annuus]